MMYFNPRPPVRGATSGGDCCRLEFGFQSTPPCAGGDTTMHNFTGCVRAFQSTPPCAGGDYLCYSQQNCNFYFNPRPPVRGATQISPHLKEGEMYFNPRPPVRGATPCPSCLLQFSPISIHAPLCGGRHGGFFYGKVQDYFNPRPPVRGATVL